MKSENLCRAIAVLLSLFCFSCETFEEDNYPVSAKIDGVVYESRGGLLQLHDVNAQLYQYEDGFTILLSRTIYHGDTPLSLGIYASPEGYWKLDRKYPVVAHRETNITRFYGDSIVCQYAKSGWLMLTDTTTRSGNLRLSGEFEIVFEGQDDNEETILTEGRFNSIPFYFSKQSTSKYD